MDAIHQFEIIVNIFLQSLGSWLDVPMKAFSFFGTEEFYMLVMPALYWCVDSALGLQVGLMLLLSNGLNAILKFAFHLPRPYWVNVNVRAISAESSFGIPSGHAQNAASVWGLLGNSIHQKWAVAASLLLVGVIGLSRLYLGVHFLSDVLVGWVAGGLLLLGFVWLQRPTAAWLNKRSLSQVCGICTASSVLLLLLIPLVRLPLNTWQIPQAWSQNALAAAPGTPIDPLNVEGAFTLSGTWIGLTCGAAWFNRRHGVLATSGPLGQRGLRYLVGATGVVVLWFGLGKLFAPPADLPQARMALYFGLRYFRYALVGLWISALAPLLFQRLRLVK